MDDMRTPPGRAGGQDTGGGQPPARVLAVFPFVGRVFVQESRPRDPKAASQITVRPPGRELARVVGALRGYHGPDSDRFLLLRFDTFDAWRATDGQLGVGTAADEDTVHQLAGRLRTRTPRASRRAP